MLWPLSHDLNADSTRADMWQSIRNNEGIASEKGIELRAYATSHGGYPPCGVPLLSDATIDMTAAMGGTGNVTAGIVSLRLSRVVAVRSFASLRLRQSLTRRTECGSCA